MMNTLELTSHKFRKARTRSLIQLGSLIETAGLLETFSIILGEDLQQNPEMKLPVSALFKGLLELNAMVKSGDFYIPLLAEQVLEAFGKLKREKSQ